MFGPTLPNGNYYSSQPYQQHYIHPFSQQSPYLLGSTYLSQPLTTPIYNLQQPLGQSLQSQLSSPRTSLGVGQNIIQPTLNQRSSLIQPTTSQLFPAGQNISQPRLSCPLPPQNPLEAAKYIFTDILKITHSGFPLSSINSYSAPIDYSIQGSKKAIYRRTEIKGAICHSINSMPEYGNTCLVELRARDYVMNNNTRPFPLV
ncbi:Uncharacterized protein QTN25_001942 [Entamoeba marina]